MVKFERRNWCQLEVVRCDAVANQNRDERSILLLTDTRNYAIREITTSPAVRRTT